MRFAVGSSGGLGAWSHSPAAPHSAALTNGRVLERCHASQLRLQPFKNFCGRKDPNDFEIDKIAPVRWRPNAY